MGTLGIIALEGIAIGCVCLNYKCEAQCRLTPSQRWNYPMPLCFGEGLSPPPFQYSGVAEDHSGWAVSPCKLQLDCVVDGFMIHLLNRT